MVERRIQYCTAYVEAIKNNTLPPVYGQDQGEVVQRCLEDGVGLQYLRSLSSLNEELVTLNTLHDAISRAASSCNKLSLAIRRVEVLASSPDVRPTSHTYVQKQDVEYCTVRVGNVPKLCCKTVAVELANAFVGSSLEENTVENYTLWYFRTCRFNMTASERLEACEGTIKYAEELIRIQRAKLGLPYNDKYNAVKRSVSVGQQILSTFHSAWMQSEGMPLPARFLSSATFLAGMPYGVFGVRAMRPIKQDF